MRVSSVLAAAAALAAASVASAGPIYSFYKLTNNGNPNVASQLSVEVIDATDGGGAKTAFKFFNNVGTASSITDVYFADGTLLGISTIASSAGVSFTNPASPSELPGANTASPPFVTTQNFSADSTPPILANGVDAAAEWLTITFNLINGKTYANTLTALADGSLRIGLHVQGIGIPGGSDSYIDTPVPLPSGTFMAMAGIGVVGIRRRRSL